MSDNQTNILDDEFMKDAEEGLQQIADKKKLLLIADQLNQDLNRKLQQKKARKNKRKIKESPWTYLAIFLIILLAILTYLVVHKLSSP